MIFPIGQEDGSVQRLPWVSISIAIVCAIFFVFTWLLPSATPEAATQALTKAAVYWAERPYLEPSPELKARIDSPALERFLTAYRAHGKVQEAPSDEDALHDEQTQLDGLVRASLAVRDRMPMHALSLVPARGPVQVGWVTHLFLHFGWMHLIGNLFFLYLVGPFLEDVWGRPLFAGFYFVGGLLAGLAQYAISAHSDVMIAGASGAIAAAMGAFAVRFATRKVRFAYFFWILRIFTGTFKMAAWLCGLLWFGQQLFYFAVSGSNSGVAFAAHIAGFAFGAVFAVVLTRTGIEAKVLAPKLEAAQGGWSVHPRLAEARTLLEQNDTARARIALAQLLAEQPANEEALLALGRIELEAGEQVEGMQRVGQLLGRICARKDGAGIRLVLLDLGQRCSPALLRPALAYQVAQTLEGEAATNAAIAEPFYRAAVGAGGLLGGKALVRAAEINLELHQPAQALEVISRARTDASFPEPLQARLAELKAAADAAMPAAVALSAETGALSPSVTPCTLLRITDEALELEGGGRRVRLPMDRVLGVAVGKIPNGQRQDVVTDLVLAWGGAGAGAKVLRFSGRSLNLSTHFAGVDGWTAHGQLVERLLLASGATPLPDGASLQPGRYRVFADVAGFEAACYGATSEANAA